MGAKVKLFLIKTEVLDMYAIPKKPRFRAFKGGFVALIFRCFYRFSQGTF